jgi:hypothetical protein
MRLLVEGRLGIFNKLIFFKGDGLIIRVILIILVIDILLRSGLVLVGKGVIVDIGLGFIWLVDPWW